LSQSSRRSSDEIAAMSIVPEIRRAVASDAERISRLIVSALHRTNARDYPAHVISAVAANFSPERVAAQLATRQAYVAVIDGAVVGTASLDGSVVRSVYVDPAYQGNGIGARLMDLLEALACEQSVTTLSVPSSITAEGFYRKRGFVSVRDHLHGDERTIIMKKDFDGA
jgi:N-acetylglutamate synthase-like GNAT family acetyltransferase